MGLLGYWCFRSIRCWNQRLLHPSMHKMLLRKYEEDIIINKFHKGDLTILENFTYTANGKRQTLAWVNSRQPLVSPPNDVWETRTEIPYWWRVTTSASDWFNQISHAARLIRHYPSLLGAWWSVIGMEFLRSFLRRHLAGKPVVASPNVGYFVRLGKRLIQVENFSR